MPARLFISDHHLEYCTMDNLGERNPVQHVDGKQAALNARLAAYLGAAASGALLASEAGAVVVSNTAVQPFGINGEANIDFNLDGQIDFQVDHDRVLLDSTQLDYLQIDKNDENGAENPLDYPGISDSLQQIPFPTNGTNANSDSGVLSFTNDFGDIGGYAVALQAGDTIGADSTGSLLAGTVWDYQEGDNFLGGGTSIRANRLIDEDQGQLDTNAGRTVTVPFGPQPEFPDLEGWTGLNGEVRYLGVRVDLNDAAAEGLNNADDPEFAQQHWYGWIGVRITNEADATGEVVGYAYETERGASITAGDTGPALLGDYNGDSQINLADYTVWRDNLGGTTLPNEGASPNIVDEADYTFWKTAFSNSVSANGTFASLSASPVPEPSSMGVGVCLALLGTLVLKKLRG
jgi:hypothetical protein